MFKISLTYSISGFSLEFAGIFFGSTICWNEFGEPEGRKQAVKTGS